MLKFWQCQCHVSRLNSGSEEHWSCIAMFSSYSINSLQWTHVADQVFMDNPEGNIEDVTQGILHTNSKIIMQNQNWHHKNQTGVVNRWVCYKSVNVNCNSKVHICHWLGSALLLHKLASPAEKHREQSVLPCTPFSYTVFVSASRLLWKCTSTACRKLIPGCCPWSYSSALFANRQPLSRSRPQPTKNYKTPSAFLQWSVTAS